MGQQARPKIRGDSKKAQLCYNQQQTQIRDSGPWKPGVGKKIGPADGQRTVKGKMEYKKKKKKKDMIEAREEKSKK